MTALVPVRAEEIRPGGVDPATLAEVRKLGELPQALVAALGRGKVGLEGFAEVGEPFNSTDVVDSRLPLRRFLVAGLGAHGAIVAYEQGGADYMAHPYRARTYVLDKSTWKQSGEWPLSRPPHVLHDVISQLTYQLMSEAGGWGRLVRIQETRPARRDSPLREANISDNEVREIQAAAHGVVPDSLVNISGVVTGCPCEEGPGCTDQVWIVAYRPGLMKGLQLSRINQRWMIGVVQRWWLDLESIDDHRDRYPSWTAYWTARQELDEKFPACTGVSGEGAVSPTESPPAGAKAKIP